MTSRNFRSINIKSGVICKAKRLGFTFHDTPSGLILRRSGRIEYVRFSYPAINQLLDELSQ